MDNLSRIEILISKAEKEYNTDLINLLHELWFSKNQEEFDSIVSSEPREELSNNIFQYVFTAAVIQYFAMKKKLNPPQWACDEEKYKLDYMWYSTDWKPLMSRYLIISPGIFARRNIFIDGESLIPM